MTAPEVTDLSNNDGRISAAVRVNGEPRSTPTDLAPDARFPIYSITKWRMRFVPWVRSNPRSARRRQLLWSEMEIGRL
jgi:hypothetical protein